ncbi:MAG: protein kinase [Candidatus Riflebacteria bacterium]|nr:protein kinase [Candidatus Riflebacteria bacterium]
MSTQRCPSCGQDVIAAPDGSELLSCQACGALLVPEDLTRIPLLTRDRSGIHQTQTHISLSGEFLKKYRLEQVLGVGGFGVVFRALELTRDRPVAVKFLRRLDSEEHLTRFRREGRFLLEIHHRNVVRVIDVGEIGRHPYLAIELLEAGTLREYLGRHARLDPIEGSRLALDCLAGLRACHRIGVVHRDLKPENILLSGSGEAKIGDLGVAKSWGDATGLTDSGAVVGSYKYMSPEQIRGEPTGMASDLFSMGLILYEMLAGQHPLANPHGEVPPGAALAVAPPPIQQLVPGVTEPLAKVVQTALARRISDRYLSAHDFVLSLRRAVPEAATSDQPRNSAGPPRRPAGRPEQQPQSPGPTEGQESPGQREPARPVEQVSGQPGPPVEGASADQTQHTSRPPSEAHQVVEQTASRPSSHDAAASSPSPLPDWLGDRFVEGRLIHEGARGNLFCALTRVFRRQVAVKLPRAESGSGPTSTGRLLHEGHILEDLHHPNLVNLVDLRADRGQPCLVFEWLNGRTLRALTLPLTIDRALMVALHVARALEHAHARGIVHGDVSPANIFECENGRCVLIGFGLARTDRDPWEAGVIEGTPVSMAPERWRGERPSAAGDLYSLGSTLYELLTGTPPFQSASLGDLAHAHQFVLPAPPSSIRPELTARIDQLVLKALAKPGAERHSSASEMAAALEGARELAAGAPSAVAPVGGQPVVADERVTLPDLVRALLPPFLGIVCDTVDPLMTLKRRAFEQELRRRPLVLELWSSIARLLARLMEAETGPIEAELAGRIGDAASAGAPAAWRRLLSGVDDPVALAIEIGQAWHEGGEIAPADAGVLDASLDSALGTLVGRRFKTREWSSRWRSRVAAAVAAWVRPGYRDRFQGRHTIFAIIHAVSASQTLRNAEIAWAAGCDGVFLVAPGPNPRELLDTHGRVVAEFPNWWIGISCPDMAPLEVLRDLPDEVAGVWVDSPVMTEGATDGAVAEQVTSALIGGRWRGFYFGGLAVTHATSDQHVQRVTDLAARCVDVLTAAGPGAGQPPPKDRVEAARAVPVPVALAITTGISPETVFGFVDLADSFVVGSGISSCFGQLDPRRVRALVSIVRSWEGGCS